MRYKSKKLEIDAGLTICGRFVHERGFYTALFNLGVLGGINLGPPIGQFICQNPPLQIFELTEISSRTHYPIRLLQDLPICHGRSIRRPIDPDVLFHARDRLQTVQLFEH